MEAVKPGVMSLSHFQHIITFRKHNNCHTPGTEKVPQVQYQVSIIDCVCMWVRKESIRKVIHQHRYEALGGRPIFWKIIEQYDLRLNSQDCRFRPHCTGSVCIKKQKNL